MSEAKGTTITLPKGTKVIEQGGAFALGGTTGRLAEDAEITFDRVMEEDELAAMFVAGNRPELLSVLKGKYNISGAPILDPDKVPRSDDPIVDAPELARRERQRGEDDRLKANQKNIDQANKAAFKGEEAKRQRINDETIRASELTAEDKALAIDRDLRAKAAVADYETVKDDTSRATDKVIFAEQSGGEVRGFEASIGEVKVEDVLNLDDRRKIAPDLDQLERERRAVGEIGIENAAVAKAHKTGWNVNDVMHKDGTNIDSAEDNVTKEDTITRVDEDTDLSFLPTDPHNPDDKAVKKNEKEVETGKKETDKESTDTKTAEKLLKEDTEIYEKNKLASGKPDEKAAARAKTDEQVTEAKTKAAAKAIAKEETKLPVKK